MGLEKYPGDIVIGKRFASGTVPASTCTNGNLIVSGLTFKPNRLLVSVQFNGSEHYNADVFEGKSTNQINWPSGQPLTIYANYTQVSTNWVPTDTGFTFKLFADGAPHGSTVYWEAYQV